MYQTRQTLVYRLQTKIPLCAINVSGKTKLQGNRITHYRSGFQIILRVKDKFGGSMLPNIFFVYEPLSLKFLKDTTH